MSSPMHAPYLIKDLAQKTGLSTDSIRFYEKKNLLHASVRGSNNYRYYDENMLKRLIFIKRCRELDLSIHEIEQLILLEQQPTQSCSAVNALIANHIIQVTDKIKELEKFQQQLLQLSALCQSNQQINDCEILKRLEVQKTNKSN